MFWRIAKFHWSTWTLFNFLFLNLLTNADLFRSRWKELFVLTNSRNNDYREDVCFRFLQTNILLAQAM